MSSAHEDLWVAPELRTDFRGRSGLRAWEVDMAPANRISLARQLFALITMELEDAATLAAEGQASHADHRGLAEKIVRYANNLDCLARALRTTLD